MVEFLKGKREIHAFGKEAVAYGTQAASIGNVFGKDARLTNIEDDAGFDEVINANNDVMTVEGFEQTVERYGGVIVNKPQNWKILQYVFGSVADAGSNPYTHTFQALSAASTLPSFTYQRILKHSSSTKTRTYLGCKVKEYSLEWRSQGPGAAGKMVEERVSFVAQDMNPAVSAATPTPPTTAAFKARHVKLTINGTERVEVTSGNITINPHLHDAEYSNSTNATLIGEPTPQYYTIDGRFTILDKDDTWVDFWKTYAEISSTNTLEFIRGSNDQLVITLTGLIMKAVPSESNLTGVNSVDIVWQARIASAVATDAISTY